MWFTIISVLEKLPSRSECGSQQSPCPIGLPIFWVRERIPDLGFPIGLLIGFLIRFPIVLNKVFYWYFPSSTFIRSPMPPPRIPDANYHSSSEEGSQQAPIIGSDRVLDKDLDMVHDKNCKGRMSGRFLFRNILVVGNIL